MKEKNRIKVFNSFATIILLVSQFLAIPFEVFATAPNMIKESMEITDEVLTEFNSQYDTYYYSEKIDYLYDGKQVVAFPNDTQIEIAGKRHELKNKATEVSIEQEEGNISISLSNLSVPVSQIASTWNSTYQGVTEVTYDTDIPGRSKVRSGSLTKPIQFTNLEPGEYHLTNGQIFEKTNEYSPGFDFDDGEGVVKERYFGRLPDIKVVVAETEAEKPATPTHPTLPTGYLGTKTEAKVYDDFENDLWLQYQQKSLDVGDTASLYPWRVHQIVSNPISNDVSRPDFHFEVIAGDSVSLSDEVNQDKTTVTAEKAGTSVVKVTYDAVEYKEKNWGASSPVNTDYAIFTVGETGRATIELSDELQNWRHYDTIYYNEGETTPFTFTSNASNAKSVRVLVNGLEIQGNNHDYTAHLENRSNIISVEATDEDGGVSSVHRVVDARFIEVNVANKTTPDQLIVPGDKATVSFKGITMPVYKLATIYNPTMNAWGGKGTHVAYQNEQLGEFKGKAGQWDLATKNSFDVVFKEAGTYKFTSPTGIFSSWWGSPLGTDITAAGSGEPNLNAPILEDDFSKMPDFSVEVKEKAGLKSLTLNKENLSIEVGTTEQLLATVDPESEAHRVVWSSSDEEKATVNQEGTIIALQPGTVTITATIDDLTATANVEITGEPVEIPVEDIVLQFEQLSFDAGGTKQLEYTVVPNNATNKEPVFTSDNERIAQVSADGLLKAVGSGQTNVHIQIGDIKKTWSVSFNRSYEATKVVNEINNLPKVAEVTLKDEGKIIKARTSFNNLETDFLKDQVNNLEKLMAAEARIKELKEEVVEENEIITFTIERFTIGQGFFQEPIQVPFTKGERVSEILDRYIKEHNHEYEYGGTLQSMFYLQGIKNADTGKVVVPTYIAEYLGGPTTEEAIETGNDDDYLGEFDYSFGSGWMYFVNNQAPNVGMADHFAKNDDVMRLQFTLMFGSDLGNSDFSPAIEELVFSNKDESLKSLALFNGSLEKERLLESSNVKKAYKNLMLNVQNALIPQEQLDLSLREFKKAIENPTATDLGAKKAAAVEKVISYKDSANYREAEQTRLTAIIDEAKQGIEEAATEAEVETVLANALTKIDGLKTNAELIKEEEEAASKELAIAKQEAAEELDTYRLENYREAEKKKVEELIADGKKEILVAETKDEITVTLSKFMTELAAIKNDAELTKEEEAAATKKLAEQKAEAKDILTNYKKIENYRAPQQEEIKNYLETGLAEIEVATAKSEIDIFLKASLAKLDTVKTDAELTKEEEETATGQLAKAKTEAVVEVSNYKKAADYRSDEQKDLNRLVISGTKEINDAKTKAAIDGIVKETKENLDELKTDAQLTAEENVEEEALTKAKADAKTKISQYKDPENYRQAEQKELAKIIVDAHKKIDAASSITEVEETLKVALVSLESVKTDSELVKDEPQTSENPNPISKKVLSTNGGTNKGGSNKNLPQASETQNENDQLSLTLRLIGVSVLATFSFVIYRRKQIVD